jgi:hypothetical protein
MNIFGVDFSGALDAGRKIWICQAQARDDRLYLNSLTPVMDLPSHQMERDKAIAVLRAMIAESGVSVWGMDFPFSLAAAHMGYPTWEAFVRAFASDYPNPELLRVRDHAWRYTDKATKTPLGPTNLRIYRQTYYGIRDLLALLCVDDHPDKERWSDTAGKSAIARAIPMQAYDPALTALIEVCPTSTLRRMGTYRAYKGTVLSLKAERVRITTILEAVGVVWTDSMRALIPNNADADSLDAVIAAYAAWQAIPVLGNPVEPIEQLEGKVYA